MRVATVRVKDDQSPGGFKIINESDFTADHELHPEQDEHFERGQAETEQAVALRCMAHVIGLRQGKTSAEWFAQPGVTRLEQLQAAEIEIRGAATTGIPPDWQEMHWKTQVKLAKSLGYNGEPSGEQAREFIAAAVEARSGQ